MSPEEHYFTADGLPAKNGDAVARVVMVGRGVKLLYFKSFSTSLSPVEMQAEEAAAIRSLIPQDTQERTER